MLKATKARPASKYGLIIEKIFETHYKKGVKSFQFSRTEFAPIASELGIELPKNLGDITYSYRFRKELPKSICETADEGMEWIIKGSGSALYTFKQVKLNRIVPREELITIKVPDATPEIIASYSLSDEQALLAKVRYNRLIDIFLGITAYSLQNHLRTQLKEIGQIEIDEVYVGIDKHGRQFIVPVQAKGGNDKHGVVQTEQDILFCQGKFPDLVCRAVSVQFMSNGRIAMFELVVQDDEVKILEERHYQLVPASAITISDLNIYNLHGS